MRKFFQVPNGRETSMHDKSWARICLLSPRSCRATAVLNTCKQIKRQSSNNTDLNKWQLLGDIECNVMWTPGAASLIYKASGTSIKEQKAEKRGQTARKAGGQWLVGERSVHASLVTMCWCPLEPAVFHFQNANPTGPSAEISMQALCGSSQWIMFLWGSYQITIRALSLAELLQSAALPHEINHNYCTYTAIPNDSWGESYGSQKPVLCTAIFAKRNLQGILAMYCPFSR